MRPRCRCTASLLFPPLFLFLAVDSLKRPANFFSSRSVNRSIPGKIEPNLLVGGGEGRVEYGQVPISRGRANSIGIILSISPFPDAQHAHIYIPLYIPIYVPI
ncbi:hypothetical protein GGS23DRAFT_574708 [Durotheca rogersii]|uniref:uncharacterized protein n=1 Tax=Durotheca rogersii TaxID=419775 RepID=UPI00222070EE|nr:uncharacterized protein GGS23DRAFT_574708 [Durotheca rogersii]KAI5861742.1 hypothetical protein GGS23DRAFT_574708 [Durotheca rogersii]